MNRRVQDPKEFFQLSPDGKTATLHLNSTSLVKSLGRLLSFLAEKRGKTGGAFQFRAIVTCGIQRRMHQELNKLDPKLIRREERSLRRQRAHEAKVDQGLRDRALARAAAKEAATKPADNVVAFHPVRSRTGKGGLSS